MGNPNSVTGQVRILREQGYTAEQIHLELRSRPGMGNTTLAQVKAVLKETAGRGGDSRRLYEVWEICLETLNIVRELANAAQKKEIAARMRGMEKRITGRPD